MLEPLTVMTLPDLNKFEYYDSSHKQMKQYNESMKRDFLKGLVLQDICYPCNVYSVTMCRDDLRNSSNSGDFELNANASGRGFVKLLRKKKIGIVIRFVSTIIVCPILILLRRLEISFSIT